MNSVQILGGYGFCAEYPAERYYRDSRINRIWEGTNEINRMLVPGTLMQRAMKGKLNLLQAAQAIPGELMSYSPLSVQLPDTPLALQEHMIKMMKKLALMIAGGAAMKFQQKLAKEQEVLGKLADIIIEIFAMESGLLRTLKIIDIAQGKKRRNIRLTPSRSTLTTPFPKSKAGPNRSSPTWKKATCSGRSWRASRNWPRYQPIDAVTLKREIADRIIDLEAYPF